MCMHHETMPCRCCRAAMFQWPLLCNISWSIWGMSRHLCGNSLWTLTCWSCGMFCMDALFGWGQAIGAVQLNSCSCTYLSLHLSSGQDAGESHPVSLASASLGRLPKEPGAQKPGRSLLCLSSSSFTTAEAHNLSTEAA